MVDINEKILMEIGVETLQFCEGISEIWDQILESPFFWLRKCFDSGLFAPADHMMWKGALRVTYGDAVLRQGLKEMLDEVVCGFCPDKDPYWLMCHTAR